MPVVLITEMKIGIASNRRTNFGREVSFAFTIILLVLGGLLYTNIPGTFHGIRSHIYGRIRGLNAHRSVSRVLDPLKRHFLFKPE